MSTNEVSDQAEAMLKAEGYEVAGQKSITFTGGIFWALRGSKPSSASGRKRRAGVSALMCRYAVVTIENDGTVGEMKLVTKREKELTEAVICRVERSGRRKTNHKAHTDLRKPEEAHAP